MYQTSTWPFKVVSSLETIDTLKDVLVQVACAQVLSTEMCCDSSV